MESISTERDHYLVEKITGIAIDKENKKYYKVQWAPSWENEENLVACGELIKLFILEQANEINAEFQQQTGGDNIKQENSLQSVNEVINQSSQNGHTGDGNIKLEAVLSSNNGEISQSSQNRSSNNANECSTTVDQMEDTNHDSSSNLDVGKKVKVDQSKMWFNMIGRGSAETSTHKSTELDISSKPRITQTDSNTSSSKPRITQTDSNTSSSKPRITKTSSKKKTSNCIPRKKGTSNQHPQGTFSQSNIMLLFQRDTPLKSQEVIHIEEEFFKCSVCGKVFETIGNLHLHNKTHNSISTGVEGNTSTKGNSITERKIKLEGIYNLQKEISPKSLKAFKCVACGKTFKNSTNLKKHIKTHKGSLKCKQCFQKFYRYHSLNLHVMNVHTSGSADFITSQKEESGGPDN